nr:nitrate reductase subunit alpha [Candidatus Pantoea persica]
MVLQPLQHDSPDELAAGDVRDWKKRGMRSDPYPNRATDRQRAAQLSNALLRLVRGWRRWTTASKASAGILIKRSTCCAASTTRTRSRRSTPTARTVVSQRVPAGMTMMYHAQERLMNIPGSEITGQRGGIHNSATCVCPKPTHMIGGYAQLAYGFN